MSFPAGETVTIHRPGVGTTTDRWGNDIPGADVNTALTGCAVWQTGADELLAGQDVNVRRMRVVFPSLISVLATDEMTVRGQRLYVDGPPARFHSPFTGSEVTQVDLVARN